VHDVKLAFGLAMKSSVRHADTTPAAGYDLNSQVNLHGRTNSLKLMLPVKRKDSKRGWLNFPIVVCFAANWKYNRVLESTLSNLDKILK
jgi:hypothetical protein